jgi:hypothetical protein
MHSSSMIVMVRLDCMLVSVVSQSVGTVVVIVVITGIARVCVCVCSGLGASATREYSTYVYVCMV